MILFDLKCSNSHVFEAWFANSASYEDQQRRHLVVCPLCGDTDVAKAVMAPNVGAKSNQLVPAKPSAVPLAMQAPPGADNDVRAMLAKIAQIQAETLKHSTWVGSDFDRQARAMDAGEAEHGLIHGQATQEQAKALVEDGIGVMPLLVPIVPPDQRN